MKRAAMLIAVVLALGGATAGLLRGAAAPPPDEVATYTVARQGFVRRVTAEGNLRAVKATRLATPRGGARMGPMKIAWMAPDGSQVKAGEVVVRFDAGEYEKQLRDGQADLEAAHAKLSKETVKSADAVAGRDRDAVLARDELDRTQRFQAKDAMIFSRNQIIESEVDQQLAGAKQVHAEHAKQIERRLSVSNAAVIAVERQKAELAISHARAALKSMELTAPSDGIFVLERGWRGQMPKIGDSMWPGQTIAEIPILDAMEASVYVLEVDGSGLAEGQPAQVVVEARPDRVFEGKIGMVDKLAQPRQPGSPVQYFGVAIALARTDREVMKPGQRVRATLVLAEEDALVVPRQAIVDREGKPTVFRRAASQPENMAGGPGDMAGSPGDMAGGFKPVVVELGAATSGRVVITKGLAAGDVIALRDPTAHEGRGSDGSGTAERAR